MKSLCEGCGTFHAHDGKFCAKKHANTMSKDGERLKVIRQYKRVTGEVQLHGRRKAKPKRQAEAIRHANLARAKMAMMGDLSAPGFVTMGDVIGEEKAVIKLTDDDIIDLGKEVAADDPRKVFYELAIIRLAKEKRGLPKTTKVIAANGDRIIRRLMDMADEPIKTRRISDGRARGTFKVMKLRKGKGLEFRRVDKGEIEILVNGEEIGTIEAADGERLSATAGVNIAYEKVHELDLYTRNVRPTGQFKKISDAKKWVKTNLDKIMKDLVT